jgi:hypothetical protein
MDYLKTAKKFLEERKIKNDIIKKKNIKNLINDIKNPNK